MTNARGRGPGLTCILATAMAVAGCPQPAPEPEPAPVRAPVDSSGINDSIARAAQRRRDSLARAERDRIARDSLAGLDRVRREADEVRTMLVARIHFEYDRAEIRQGEDMRMLDQKIAIMQRNPDLVILIVGHADERGSDEYNLALGNRRALAARKYMTDRGIAGERLRTDSRGEEQPADPSTTEAAFAVNRRAEFSITTGGESLRRPSGM